MKLKKNLVIGHALLINPYSMPISSILMLKKPMYFKLNHMHNIIPQNLVTIKYYAYDLEKDKIGNNITQGDGSVIIKSKEAVLAKIILMQDFELSPFKKESDFWQTARIEVGFSKIGIEKPSVDGLMLSMMDASTGKVLNEFSVPWGDNHLVRKRTSSRFGSY